MSENKSSLDSFATSFTKFVLSVRWLVVILAIIASGYVGSFAQNLTFTDQYRAFFGPQNPELTAFEAFQDRFVKSDNISLVVKRKDGGDIFRNDVIGSIGQITEGGWKIPYARRVDSLTNFQNTYSEDDALIVEDLFETPGENTEEEVARQKAIALAEPLLFKQVVSENAEVTAVNITLNLPGKSTEETREAVAAARALRDDVLAANPNIEILMSGATLLSNAFSEAIFADFQTLIPLMIGLIIVMTWIVIRSLSATFTTVLIVILSASVGMGWAGFVGIELAGPSPSATIVILTLAIADSMHILVTARTAMRGGMEKREAIIEAMRANFLAVTITSITTIVGFLALNFSDSPPFRDFGNISAVGIAAAWALSLTLLPALLMITPFKVAPSDKQSDFGFMGALAEFVIGNYRLLFVALGAGTIALVACMPLIEFNDRFVEYFDKRIQFRTDTDEIGKYLGVYQTEFTMEASESGGINDPAYLEKLDAFANWLREKPYVTHVYSVTDIIKRLNKNFNGDDPAFYRLPTEYDLSAQYFLLYELSLPYGLDLNDRIDIDKSATRLTATLSADMSTLQVKKLLRESAAWFDKNAPSIKATPTGPQVLFTFITDRNVQSMIKGTALAIAAIAVIMMLALRSFSIGLLSLAPNGMPILAAFGAWALIVGEVGFAVAAVASLSLGIVIDDTVHFLTKYTRARKLRGLSAADAIRHAFKTVGVAIVFNTMILGLGFGILVLSAFKINAQLGLLTTLSIGFALILDFLFLPALLLMVSREGTGSKAATP